MNPLIQALFGPWELRPAIVLSLLIAAALYTIGWRRLRARRSGQSSLANGWRLAAYLGGLLLVAIALLSPIDILGGQLFFMHMIQHLLTIMVAAPLLCLANPFPVILWGLPRASRRRVARLFMAHSPLPNALRAVTHPGVAWLVFLCVYLGWHEPSFYNLALRREWVHDVEHITFFAAALLYWWHVVGNGPRLHPRMPLWARIAYLLGAIPPNAITGAVIAFGASVIYTYYESIPRIWRVSLLDDQMWGGIIMWIPGSMMYIIFALIALSQMVRAQREPSAPGERTAHPPIAAAQARPQTQTLSLPNVDVQESLR